MQFFTSPEDLGGWIKSQQSPNDAVQTITNVVGLKYQQDITETCEQIFNSQKEDVVINASKVLYNVLAKYNITNLKEGNMKNNKIKKEAQIMRQPGEYNMPLRVCPKLPYSVGKRLISTYNCRHYCLDSITFDDDPERVYCAEALWRQHVMDKFSRDWKDKDGNLVGGYINERFEVCQNDAGNRMGLANGERTRKQKPNNYSVERRLEEARGEKTEDITLASNNRIKKIASSDVDKDANDDPIYQMFSDSIDMKTAGLDDETVLMKLSDHYNVSIVSAAEVLKLANKMYARNHGVVYSCNSNKRIKTADFQSPNGTILVTLRPVEVIAGENEQAVTLKNGTLVFKVDDSIYEIVDGPDAGAKFRLVNPIDSGSDVFGVLEGSDGISEGAEDVGL